MADPAANKVSSYSCFISKNNNKMMSELAQSEQDFSGDRGEERNEEIQ